MTGPYAAGLGTSLMVTVAIVVWPSLLEWFLDQTAGKGSKFWERRGVLESAQNYDRNRATLRLAFRVFFVLFSVVLIFGAVYRLLGYD